MRGIHHMMYSSVFCMTLLLTPHAGTSISPDNETIKVKMLLDSSIDSAKKARDILQGGTCPPEPKDCEEILACGHTKSGVYKILPATRLKLECLEVFCDMDTDGGGWTVIQRRGDFGRAKDYFYKDWEAYKKGFGDVSQDFWIGNDAIFALTNQKHCSLRFDLKDLVGNKKYASYDNFWVDSENFNYTLHVEGYTGSAGDSFAAQSGNQFTTKDRDNDLATQNCAVSYKGAWWYNKCHSSNLNGLYLNGTHETSAEGVNWLGWLGQKYSLPFTEMKIRGTFFNKETTVKFHSEDTPQ